MSSPKFLLALLIGLTAAGCQVRPLYAPSSVSASEDGPVIAAMKSIAVEAQTERVAQSLMNEVIFALRGGAALENPRYTLRLIVTTRTADLSIEKRAEVPTAKLVALTTTYTLTSNVDSRVVANGTLYTTASFDFSSQRFANLRAQQDAEDRAARSVATDVRTRLAMALSDLE